MKSIFSAASRFGGYVMAGVVLILCLLIYPGRIVGETIYKSEAPQSGMEYVLMHCEEDDEDMDYVYTGSFKPEHPYVRTMSFMFRTKGSSPLGELTLTLEDENGDVVYEETKVSADIMNYHPVVFKVDSEVKTGKEYMYTLSSEEYREGEIYIGVVDENCAAKELTKADCSIITDNDVKEEDRVSLKNRKIYTELSYKDRADEKTAGILHVIVIAAGMLLYMAVKMPMRDCVEKESIHSLIQKGIFWAGVLVLGLNLISMLEDADKPVEIAAADMNYHNGWTSDTAIGISSNEGYKGEFLTMGPYLLGEKGRYTIGIAYHTEYDKKSEEAAPVPEEPKETEPAKLTLFNNGIEMEEYELEDLRTYQEFEFELEESCPEFRASVSYGLESDRLIVDSITIRSENGFNSDNALLKIIFTALWTAGVVVYILCRYKIIAMEGVLTTLLLAGIGLIGSLAYLRGGLQWAVDLHYHLCRIEGIKDGMLAGQFPVVIYPKALHGNGYLNLMYPGGILYFAALIRQTGVSLVDSFKLMMTVMSILTAVFTYRSVKSMTGSRHSGLIASFAYTLSAYRFTNIFARGAIGEALAMTFFPLVMAGLYHVLCGDRKKWYYLTFGITGLVYTHVLSAVMAVIICFAVGIIYIKNLLAELRIVEVLDAAIVSVVLSLGFAVPFLDFYKNEELWKDVLTVTGDYGRTLVELPTLFSQSFSGSSYHILAMGTVISVCCVICIWSLAESRLTGRFKDTDNPVMGYTAVMTAIGLVSLFMTCGFFPAESFMKVSSLAWLFESFQFPWRLIGIASLMFSMAAAVYVCAHPVYRSYCTAFVLVMAVISLITAARYSDMNYSYDTGCSYSKSQIEKLTAIPVAKSTVLYPYEWRLKGASDALLGAEPEVSDEELVEVTGYKKVNGVAGLVYSSGSDEEYITLPIQAYTGYCVTDETGSDLKWVKGEGGRICIETKGDGKEHDITVTYEVKSSYKAAAAVSVIAFAAFCVFATVWRRLRRESDAQESE